MRRLTVLALLAALEWTAAPSWAQEKKAVNPPRLVWRLDSRFAGVDRVFPHPADPDVVYMITRQGIMRSRDCGGKWEQLAGKGLEDAGVATVLVQSPADYSLLYLGTRECGVYRSTDAGATWAHVGTKEKGLAGLSVKDMVLYPLDPSWRSVYVSHGESSPGLSMSEDGGDTWSSVDADRLFGKMAFLTDTLFMKGVLVAESAPVNEPDAWSLVRSENYGKDWSVVARDVRPVAGALGFLNPKAFFWATLDGGILRSEDTGYTWTRVGPPDNMPWASLCVTRGARDTEEVVCAYEPRSMGLVRSTNDMAGWVEDKRGLFVGRFVKEGADASASADGRKFFAVVNNELYVGGPVEPAKGPSLEWLRTDPPVLWLKVGDYTSWSTAGFNFRAKVSHPEGLSAIKEVSIDLEMLKGSKNLVMRDDGKHGDGQLGDGVFGVASEFRFDWVIPKIPIDRRPNLPGTAGFTVTVTDQKGARVSGTVVGSLFWRADPVTVWTAWIYTLWKPKLEGNIEVATIPGAGHDPTKAGLVITSKDSKPWRLLYVRDGGEKSIQGLRTVTFYIKADPPPKDLRFHLCDSLGLVEDWSASNEVSLVAGGYLKEITKQYQQVRIPLKDLVKDTKFKTGHCSGFGLRAPEGSPAGKYSIDDLTVIP